MSRPISAHGALFTSLGAGVLAEAEAGPTSEPRASATPLDEAANCERVVPSTALERNGIAAHGP